MMKVCASDGSVEADRKETSSMRHTVLFGAVVGVMLLCSALASAVDVQVKYTGVGPYEQVYLTHPYVGDSTFRAGVYNIMIDLEEPGVDPTKHKSFCIDLKQEVSGQYNAYAVALVGEAPLDGGSDWTPMGATKGEHVTELWHEHIGSVMGDAVETPATAAAAFQVALGEIIYENTTAEPGVDPYDVSAGDFVLIGNTSQAVIDQANAWLGTVNDGNAVLDQGLELRSLTHYSSETDWQDYLCAVYPGVIIPEPVTVISVLLGACGLGSYIRRRSAV